MFDEHMNRHAVTMKSLVHTHLQHSSTRPSLRGNARSFSDAFSIATHSNSVNGNNNKTNLHFLL